jgi:hypothetical protein
MTLSRSGIAAIVPVLALVVVALAGSAWAHIGAPSAPLPHDATVAVATSIDHIPAAASGLTPTDTPGLSPAAIVDARDYAPAGVPAATGAPAASWFPWMLLFAALSGAALAWLRPRRALVLALVLVLGVFAYETGLHSVHHGLHGNPGRCPVAAASLHVAAVTVDAPSTVAVTPLVAPTAIEAVTGLPARSLRADQGRAPPAAT